MSADQTVGSNNNLTTPLKIAALLTLALGLGFAISTIVAPLGVWTGMWDFRKGFSILRWTNANANWFVYACLALSFAVITLAFVTKNRIRGVAAMTILGTLAAAIAWYIPESFRPAGTAVIPPIHDITTNPDAPEVFVAVVPLRATASNSLDYGSGPNMTAEKLAQLQGEAYPQIKPQLYSDSLNAVHQKALKVVEDMGWELVASVPEEGRIEATDTTFWFRFKDDVVIKLTQKGEQVELNARSVSRVGVSDVGKNSARLTEFFERMKK
ncbi:DUF1499 domain-containing protein [Aurantivibrio infirmus]